jgi:hypothetical protein
MMGPKITVARKSNQKSFYKAVVNMQKMAAYVGVPADKSSRQSSLLAIAGATAGSSAKAKSKRERAISQSKRGVNNAELLFLHSKGSPIRRLPARPIVEPAVMADGNRQAIAHELAETGKLALAGDQAGAERRLQRAALAGQNAARRWFVDPRNGWPANKPETIKRKGSDRPLIDMGILRSAIVGIVSKD